MTGLGRRKVLELNNNLKENKITEENDQKRGTWKRDPEAGHRHLLTSVIFIISNMDISPS